MLYSLHAYMFWHIDNTIITIAIFVMTVLIHLFYSKYYSFKSRWNIVFFAVLAVLFGTHGNFNNYIFNVINLFPFLSFVFLKDKIKQSVFDSWRKAFCVIITISLGWYSLVVIAGVELPFIMDFYGDLTADSYYIAKNYIGFIQLVSFYSGIELERFQSIFLEPGYLACLIVMCFFIDGFEFKQRKSNVILLIALILTFSVAGYLLFVAFFVAYKVKNSRYNVASISGMVVAASLFVLFASVYNGGDNQLKKQVIDRFQYDSDRGTIEGYNRTTEDFDEYFTNFIIGPDVLKGNVKDYQMRFADQAAPNVGIKYYIVVYGLIGLLSYLVLLLSFFIRMVKKSYLTISYFALWFIIFARGNFVMWMTGFLITYVYGLIYLNEKSINRNNEYKSKSNSILSSPVSSNS